MSIIWCGGEDIDFEYKINPDYSTSTSNRRAAWSRVALDTLDTGGCIFGSPLFTPITSCWVHAYFVEFNSTTVSNYLTLYLRDSTTSALLGIGVSNTSGSDNVALLRHDGSYTLLDYETGGLWNGFIGPIDFQVVSYGASGTVKVYMNGVEVINFTGDLVGSSGATGLDQLRVCLLYTSDAADDLA